MVERQAVGARRRNAVSARARDRPVRASSSEPVGPPDIDSICRASLSPIGLDGLTRLHTLREKRSSPATGCFSALGDEPPAGARSA